MGKITEEEFDELHEAGAQIPRDRAERFYDRIRGRIQSYLDRRGTAVGKTGEFLLLVPDVFILLWRLVKDARVSGKNKVFVGSAVAYYILPFDILPEAFLGPIGYLDDLVFGAYVLNRVLTDTDPEVLREHWPGESDVLEMIQKVLAAADSLVGSEVLGKIKRMAK